MKGFKIPTENANKTQGRGLYEWMNNRAAKAFETNVAFRGLALDPYLSVSLRSSLPSISDFTYYLSLYRQQRGGRSVDMGTYCRRTPVSCRKKKSLLRKEIKCRDQNRQPKICWQKWRFNTSFFFFFSKCMLFVETHEWEHAYMRITEKQLMQFHNRDLFLMQDHNLNSYELWLTHKALTLAFKTLYKLRLNLTAQIGRDGVIYWREMRTGSCLAHYHSVRQLQWSMSSAWMKV